MTKLMFLAWDGAAGRAPLLEALHAPALREGLAAAGGERLQVNQDDDAVASAMRFGTFDAPVAAVLSVWTSGDAGAVTEGLAEGLAAGLAEGLAEAAPQLAGWEVEERRPLPPPPTADGERSDALANVAVLRRPDDLAVEEWRHRWLVDHTPVAIETQGTFGYLQNVVLGPVTPGAPRVDALVEELFPIAATTDLHAFYGSGGDDAELSARMSRMMTSVARFGADRDLDLVPTSRYCWRL